VPYCFVAGFFNSTIDGGKYASSGPAANTVETKGPEIIQPTMPNIAVRIDFLLPSGERLLEIADVNTDLFPQSLPKFPSRSI
jgi:hypothetical protein